MTATLPRSQAVGPGHRPPMQPVPLNPTVAGAGNPRANRLLATLAEPSYQRWLPHFEAVDLPLGAVLWESGRPLTHAYFPTAGMVALMYGLEDGRTSAVSVVGNEGLVGVAMFMGGRSSLGRTVVICSGRGFRLRAAPLMLDFEQGGPVARLLLRYTQALMTQLAQVVVCNRHHALGQRLCHFLLATMASALGVRREGVTEAALSLQRAGIVRYRRGHISVHDRAGLEDRTCECYAVVRQEYERLLPAVSVP
jgi:CRP-like cAMP-binding protein